MQFFTANPEVSKYNHFVPSPYIRSTFKCDKVKSLTLKVAVVGVYQLYFNDKKITKGKIAPYRANPNHYVYIDTYQITAKAGVNVIGLTLGNGIAASHADVWEFDKFSWTSAPKFAFSLLDNKKEILNGKNAKWHNSEIIYNDWHGGEVVDFNLQIKDWNTIKFDDSKWNKVQACEAPKGELFDYDYASLNTINVIKPIKKIIVKKHNRIIYDFAKSLSGIYVLKVQGKKGQKISIQGSDALVHHERLHITNLALGGPERDATKAQKDIITLSGEVDVIENQFSFKGYRYLQIDNVDDLKIIDIYTQELSSISKTVGSFKCNNEIVNKLQTCTLNSDLSNFIFFPLDCPQREKNGWTGDGTISAEQFLLNFDVAEQYKNWLRNIVKAQNKLGAFPGIVPTDTWGYKWGAGPGWDDIIFEGAYRAYVYSGDKSILGVVHKAMIKYLDYMKTKEDANGCFQYGLGDWMPINTQTPLWIVDTIICERICDVAYRSFKILGDQKHAQEALAYRDKIANNFKKNAGSYDLTGCGLTQTQIAMTYNSGLLGQSKSPYFNIQEVAKKQMLYVLKTTNDTISCGAAGSRHLFRALADMGEQDLALDLIIQDKYPSYKTAVLDLGLTTLPEGFFPPNIKIDNLDDDFVWSYNSFNHHFWGDISAFFYRYLAGIRIDDVNTVNFEPLCFKKINQVEATHIFKSGTLKVKINKKGLDLYCDITIPKGITVNLVTPPGYKCNSKGVRVGHNLIKFIKQ